MTGKNRNTLLTLTIALATVLVVLVVLALNLKPGGDPNLGTPPTEASTEGSVPSDPPTEPPIVKESTVTISATGDLLMHLPIIDSCKQSDGTYDFSKLFPALNPYVQKADWAVANLETTFCGLGNGFPYKGYPNFNCPDELAANLKNTGFDMLLTANNHSYDTNVFGMRRTLQTLRNAGLEYMGTGEQPDFPKYTVKELNGIKVGMMCYTYCIKTAADGSIHLNNTLVPISKEATGLINYFDYSKLDEFYAQIEDNLEQMKAQGTEATVMFIHWGAEYQTTHNADQSAIAQKLCDLGIDVIIGGHPHVIQPVELFTSTTDPDHKTVCLYSMGNTVSNQFQGNLSSITTAHTEDGMLFSVTFAKYSDGTVILENAELLPTWHTRQYKILPLDKSVENWQEAYGVDSATVTKMNASYDRTMAIVGAGMEQVKNYLTQHVADTEAKLNAQN